MCRILLARKQRGQVYFHPRCPQAMSECKERYPRRTQLTATHAVHCHLYEAGK